MCNKTVLSKSRQVYFEEKAYFYNPTWYLHGNPKLNIMGSYYLHSNEPTNYFWNLFDQVIMRPSLIEYFNLDELSLITKINTSERSLLNQNGRPNKVNYSDHLPLKFNLNL
jgi:hypothetical protein